MARSPSSNSKPVDSWARHQYWECDLVMESYTQEMQSKCNVALASNFWHQYWHQWSTTAWYYRPMGGMESTSVSMEIYYLGCTNGRLVAKWPTASTYLLWDPVERAWSSFPLWDARFEFKCAALSSTCSCGRMVMILTGTSHPAFMFHRLDSVYRGSIHPDKTFQ